MASKPHDWKSVALKALRLRPVLGEAAARAGVDAATLWRARQADEAFAQAVDEAIAEGRERAVAEAYRRGLDGLEEILRDVNGNPVWELERDALGQPIMVKQEYAVLDGDTLIKKHRLVPKPLLDKDDKPVPVIVRKYSDKLLGDILRAHVKEFANKTELTGAGGGPLKVVDDTAKAARIAQLMAIAQSRKAERDEFGDLA